MCTERAFKEPADEQEARERLDVLRQDSNDIQQQLNGRDRKGSNGRRMPYKLYREWRGKAGRALKWKLREVEFLESWLKDETRQEAVKEKEAEKEKKRQAKRKRERERDILPGPTEFVEFDEHFADPDELTQRLYYAAKEMAGSLGWNLTKEQQEALDETKGYLERMGLLRT